MSTPPKATPTTPQWAIEAAKEINEWLNRTHYVNIAYIIAKHAPPLSPPTDDAKLREVIKKALRKSENQFDNIEERTDRILTALAPYLKGEPDDSELLDWVERFKGRCGYSESTYIGEGFFAHEHCQGDKYSAAPTLRAAIRAAMRCERGRSESCYACRGTGINPMDVDCCTHAGCVIIPDCRVCDGTGKIASREIIGPASNPQDLDIVGKRVEPQKVI